MKAQLVEAESVRIDSGADIRAEREKMRNQTEANRAELNMLREEFRFLRVENAKLKKRCEMAEVKKETRMEVDDEGDDDGIVKMVRDFEVEVGKLAQKQEELEKKLAKDRENVEEGIKLWKKNIELKAFVAQKRLELQAVKEDVQRLDGEHIDGGNDDRLRDRENKITLQKKLNDQKRRELASVSDEIDEKNDELLKITPPTLPTLPTYLSCLCTYLLTTITPAG